MKKLIKGLRFRTLVLFVAVVYLMVSLISAQFELMTQKREYENLVRQQEKIQEQVDETQRLADQEDKSEYIEQIARDKLGYAYPGEKIYQDIRSEE